MSGASVTGIHLAGDHASRPAGNAQPDGSLYSCTTHGLIYKSSYAGNTWSTWATLGAAPSGSITASGYTQSTARLLGRTTGSTGAIEEISVGSGLSLAAGSLSATGGSGLTHAFVGYNTIGGSTEAITARRWYLKKITIAAAGVLASVGCYVKQTSAGTTACIGVGVFEDNAGSPRYLLGINSGTVDSVTWLEHNSGSAGDARWFHLPLGIYVPAADYWIGVTSDSTTYQLYKDGSGGDRYFTPSTGIRYSDAGLFTVTTTTDKYSIRGSLIT